MRLLSLAKPLISRETIFVIAMLTVLAFCAGSVSQNRADPDLWGHVQFGEDVLNAGAIATTNSYSYTATEYPWINDAVFSEVTFALLNRIGGVTALLLFKFLMGLVVLTLIYRAMERQGVGNVARCSVLLLVSFNFLHHWTLRPQLATYVSYALILTILHWCFQGWQGRWHYRKDPQGLCYSSRRLRFLWVLPVVMFVWANFHGGFLAGYAVLLTYLIGRSCEAFWVRGEQSWPVQRRLIMMAVAAGLATLVNPYGPRLHWSLLRSLGQPRPEIMEWLAPTLSDPMSLPYWSMLAFAGLALFTSKRSIDGTHAMLLMATGVQALHQRHATFFAITCGFYLGPHIDSLLRSFGIDSTANQNRKHHGVRRGLVAVTLLVLLALQTYRIGARLVEVPVRNDLFPCEALQFMADQNMHGNLVVPYRWSQYVIGSFGRLDSPMHVKVAFDGRYRTCYPQAFVDTYFDFALGKNGPTQRFRDPRSPIYDPLRILNYSPPGEVPPNMVLLTMTQFHGIRVMNSLRDDWTRVYADGMCELWARRSVFDHPESERYIPTGVRVCRDEPLPGHRAWPAFPVFGRNDATIRNVSLKSTPPNSHSTKTRTTRTQTTKTPALRRDLRTNDEVRRP